MANCTCPVCGIRIPISKDDEITVCPKCGTEIDLGLQED